MARNGPRRILAWRPVLLFGTGLGLAVFEAVQPMLGRSVEWAIVSLAATMMGLEMFQRSRDPDDHPPGPGGRDSPGRAASPDSPGPRDDRGSPGALAVLAGRTAPAAAVAAAG